MIRRALRPHRFAAIVLACLSPTACSGTAANGVPAEPGSPSGSDGGSLREGGGTEGGVADAPATPTTDAGTPSGGDAGPGALPVLTFCQVGDPKNIAGAYQKQTGADWVSYSCTQACSDWTRCTFGLVDPQGSAILSARGQQPIQALAFVVDGMAGHFAFTPDGNDVVVTHAGSGGTSVYNPFDMQLQAMSNLKTVSLGWEPGTTQVPGSFSQGGAGWFTRRDGQGTSVRALVARPAAAIQWVQANLAAGHRFGTVGSSMGTVATLGAHVWYGLDSVLDYQMVMGGPGMWDVNAGCGRAHLSQGYCDVDVAPCTGNPISSYGNNDPVCPGGDATNNCRVPTIMAALTSGSAYDNIINYVGATTSCAPSAADSRDATLDVSSMAMTVPSWTFHGRVDFVANEGGVQPPDADQGMGEGHMTYIYTAIQSAKGWIDNQGGHHGDSWDKVPALMAAAAQHVVSGMGQ